MGNIFKTIIGAIFSFITNRLFILTLIVVGMFYVLLVSIFDLTIVQGDQLAKDFEAKILRDVDIEGQRGNIYDRNGYPLAENVIAYNVLLNDSIEVDDKNAMIHELITAIQKNGDIIINDFPLKLGEVGYEIEGSDKQVLNFKRVIFNKRYTSDLSLEQVEMSPYEVFLYLRDDLFRIDKLTYSTSETLDILTIRYAQYIKRYSKYQPEIVAENIKPETLALIEEKRDIFPGVSIVESPFRQYNDAPYFAHIIGYTREIDQKRLEVMEPLGYESNDIVGVIGIEEKMESYLRGYDGYQKVEVNNLGRTMMVLEESDPIVGNDVYLTIDRDIQIRAYHILEQQLAEILNDKILMKPPYNKDESHVLFKEVFDSIFRYHLIDSKNIDKENVFESSVYEKKESVKLSLREMLIDEIGNDKAPKDYDRYGAAYRHILEALKTDGVLANNYRSSEPYLAFKLGETPFRVLIEDLNAADLVNVATDISDDEQIFDYIYEYVTKEILFRYDFDEFIYRYLIDLEAFDYLDMTMTLINHNVVTATEDEIDQLTRRRLTPIQFMKNKILALELTPQELALDPSSGSVVISDTDTGEVLALVSYPTYDNSRLVNNFDNSYYNDLLHDPTSPLYPRATYSKSAPGSTFKMVSAMAALEEGVVGPNEKIHATGYFDKIFPAAKCWIYSRGGSHGLIDVRGAIEQSCNHFFYEMGYRLNSVNGGFSDSTGISIIEDYTSRFGLDSKTGIEIGEATSNIASRDSSRAMIGQVDHNYTPVQLSRYMNTLVNDGIMRELNIVDKIIEKKGDVVEDFTPEVVRINDFNQEHLDLVKSGMNDVTEGARGSASYYFRDLEMSVAGKTGTAQLVSSRPSHAVFVGFAPYEDPEISVATVIQFGYSSKYAALNSKKIFNMYFELERDFEGYTRDHMLD